MSDTTKNHLEDSLNPELAESDSFDEEIDPALEKKIRFLFQHHTRYQITPEIRALLLDSYYQQMREKFDIHKKQ